MGQAGAGCVLFALHADEGRAWSKSKKGCTRANAQQVSLAGLEVAQVELLGRAAKRTHRDKASEQDEETHREEMFPPITKSGFFSTKTERCL